LPWEVRSELAENFRTGCEEVNNEYRGQDAFNLSAFHALGFGVHLDESLSLKYLNIASKNGFLPAATLCEAFASNGLLDSDRIPVHNATHEAFWYRLLEDLQQIPQQLHFSRLIRAYYKHKNLQAASGTIDIGNQTLLSQDKEVLKDFLLKQDIDHLHEVWVELNIAEDGLQKPLMHHLIVAHESLADMVLRRGVEGSFFTSNGISLLHVACACGSTKIVRTLLELFPNIARQCSKDGISPLHWLFMFDDTEIPEMAKALVSNGASLDRVGVMVFTDFNLVFSGPPLHWAIMARNPAAVRALIKSGAELNEDTPMPTDCLQYSGYAVDLAVCLLMPEIVELLICHGAELRQRPDSSGMTTLHYIGDTIDPFRMWLYHGKSVKAAVKETVQILLRNGADINETSDDGITPIQWMVSRTTCITSVLEPFLDFEPKASKNLLSLAAVALQHDCLNHRKMTLLLEYCSRTLQEEDFRLDCTNALKKCTRDGTVEAARKILTHGSGLAKDLIDREELVHLAAENDHPEMISLLLDLGGNIDLDTGGTPAAAAASFAKRKALGFLLSHGATVLSLPSQTSQATLLHEIVANTSSPQESEKTLEFVCQNFRDRFLPVVNNFDDRGLTALHEAIIWGNEKNIARLLTNMDAAPLCIRGTDISPTTLAALTQEYTPWLILQQGDSSIQQHKRSMTDILRFLVESMRLEPPDLAPKDHARVTKYWTTPQNSAWAPTDQISDWYIRRNYSDTAPSSHKSRIRQAILQPKE